MNVLRGRMGERAVEVEGHTLPLGIQDGYRAGEDVVVGVRAESIEVSHDRAEGSLPAEVGVVEPLGSHLLLTLALGGQVLKVATRTDVPVRPNDQVWLRPERGSLRLLGPREPVDSACRGEGRPAGRTAGGRDAAAAPLTRCVQLGPRRAALSGAERVQSAR